MTPPIDHEGTDGRRPGQRPRVRPEPPRRRRAPHLGAIVFVVLMVAAVGGLAALRLTGYPSASAAGSAGPPDPFAARTLDPAAPQVPVPDGAVLVNAWVEGDGPIAYRLSAWTTTLPMEEVVDYYAQLRDGRWSPITPPAEFLGTASITLADARGTYDHAAVDVSATTPVQVAIRLVPREAVPAPTAVVWVPSDAPPSTSPEDEDPTIPPVTELPEGYPDWARPPAGSLVDVAGADGLFLAVFVVDESERSLAEAWLEQLRAVGLVATSSAIDGGTLIDVDGGRGQIVLEGADEGTRASVAVHP